jgi:hypothetical protein
MSVATPILRTDPETMPASRFAQVECLGWLALGQEKMILIGKLLS